MIQDNTSDNSEDFYEDPTIALAPVYVEPKSEKDQKSKTWPNKQTNESKQKSQVNNKFHALLAANNRKQNLSKNVTGEVSALYMTKQKNDKKSKPVFHKSTVKLSAP